MSKPRVIAFYLPQFYPTPENDEWWGKGFTEWTNVGKAKPLFKGHNQPRVPTELGYYDLRLPIIREQQAQMARDAGVEGFCYWHYWFGNGRRLLFEVFQEVLESGKPDFPFCLGWANHSWYAKKWNSDGVKQDKILIEQTYPGERDVRMHWEMLIKAFKDKRYIKIDGSPLLYIFRPNEVPQNYIESLKKWTIQEGFPDLFVVGQLYERNSIQESLQRGYNAVSFQRLAVTDKTKQINLTTKIGARLKGLLHNRPTYACDYAKVFHNMINEKVDSCNNVFPFILPQWDHSPRSGSKGVMYYNATPDNFYRHVKHAFSTIKNKPDEYKIVFLKSWNEWGEGNMMEPDLTYGTGFIDMLRKAIDEF